MTDVIREALQTLRDNIRDEKGKAQRFGVNDNDDTRDAIAVLLDNEAALQSAQGDMEPRVAVPDFLLEMSKQMREQPNRMTSHPFWQVRCNRYLPTLEGCSEHHTEICGDDGVVYRSDRPLCELHEYLIENHEEWCQQWAEENHDDDWKEAIECHFDLDCDDLPEELRRVPVQEIEEVVSTHLTQAGAEQFITRKQHDYPKLFTYVESAYWSPQLRELQDWIISLTAVPSGDAKKEWPEANDIMTRYLQEKAQAAGMSPDEMTEKLAVFAGLVISDVTSGSGDAKPFTENSRPIDDAMVGLPNGSFKAFHASLCCRFDYPHDDQHWWRDLVSLEEHIAAGFGDAKREAETGALEQFAAECGLFLPEYDDQEYIEIPRWRFKEFIARLRQSSDGDDSEGVE
ncbi:hypothetical protein [Marinobacter sp. Hex_13]|uniref:hypothetical protein n=1 Tax=Marinobacter sp. Hex_13 TaxID=1795866 RepID=UPI0007961C48|nr:hypothetical protein [Marinobacter sp. Hex_13]KXJ45845.1 MAG: hypothetical protein AXW11_12195 [Marinobacter sp. Hex_13]